MVCKFCKGSKTINGAVCGMCGGTGTAKGSLSSRGNSTVDFIAISPDEKIWKYKIICRCKAALMLEVPDSLKTAIHGVTCQRCRTTYLRKDGVVVREDANGIVEIHEKETKLQPGAFPAASNKWVN